MLANVKDELIQAVRQGLLSWFDFVTGMKTLYIGSEEESLSDLLKKADLNIEFAHLEQIEYSAASEPVNLLVRATRYVTRSHCKKNLQYAVESHLM